MHDDPENEFKVATLRNHFVMEILTKQKAEKPKEVLFTQQTPSHNKNQTKKEVTCFKCGTKGHIAKECRAPPWKIEKFEKEKEKEGKTPNQKTSGSKPNKKGERLLNVETFNIEEKDETDDCWYIDSGCTQHMTNRKEWLSNLEEIETFVIGPISKKLEKVNLKGDCVIKGVGDFDIRLQNTLFVSGIRRNLISVKSLCKAGARTTFYGEKFEISKDGRILLKGQINSSGLFAVQQTTEFIKDEEEEGWREHGTALVLDHSLTHSTESMVKEEEEERDQSPETVEIKEETFNLESNNKLMLWHKRLGHLSIRQMEKLHSHEGLEGLKDEDFKLELSCDVCYLGKQSTNKLSKSHKLNTKERGELIHSDVCGPISPETKGGNRYYVSFIDDFTRKSWVFLIKRKDEVLEKFREFYTLMETQHKIKIKSILSDGGGEYVNEEFKKFSKEKGFIQRITPPYTPQRNGLAERFNRTIMEKVRCMINTANFEKEFWGEAVNYANYIRNCSPTKLKEKTPEEEFSGIKPKLEKLKVFGAQVSVKDEGPKLKLDDRGIQGKMVGYNEDNHTYRIWNNNKKKLIFSKDVRFISEGDPKQINEHIQKKETSSNKVKIILGEKKKVEDDNDVRGGNYQRQVDQPSSSSSNSDSSEESS
ncbi:MAG: DDE-type integrase/transposase/recombinase, partial [Nitrosopumilus sp.]|nr:DDE-type integrase/transposase/recombinase [Nitrosopumilus sp.]